MPTVLDELVIRLGLDSRAFQTQVQQTRANLGQVGAVARRESSTLEDYLKKTQAETSQRMVQIEQVGRQVGQQLSNVKNNVLGLLGAFAGAYGLQQFVSNLVGSDAALGNFSKALGLNTEDVATWIEMGKRAGTSAESVKTAIASLSQVKQDYALRGVIPTLGIWQGLGIDPRNKSEFELLKQISEFVQKHPPELSRSLLQPLGISPDMIPLLMKGRGELEKLEVQMRALGVATAKSSEEDQNFLNSLADIQQALQDVGRAILGEFHEPILNALKSLREWIVVNREAIKINIAEFFRQAGTAIKGVADAVEKVVKLLGGWQVAAEVILGIWIGSKVAPLLTFVLNLTKLLLGAGAAVTALGVGMEKLAISAAPVWLTGLLKFLPLLTTLGFLSGDTPEGGAQKTPEEREEFIRKFHEQNPGVPLETFREFYGRIMPNWLGGSRKNTFAPTADTAMPPERRAFLDALSMGESGGDYSAKNPTSTAHGRYQFINSTDSEISARTALPGQDPVSQDRKAWFLAERTYAQNTRRDLGADLRAGGREEQIAAALKGVWPSLPGGSQQNTTTSEWMSHMSEGAARNASPQQPNIPKVGPVFGPQQLPAPPLPPPPAAATGQPSTDNSRTSSIETHISGPITVHTAATDAEGIAKGIGGALQRYNYVPQMNTGLA